MRILDVDGSVTGMSERDRARSWSDAELDREIATKLGALIVPGLARALACYELTRPRAGICRSPQSAGCTKTTRAGERYCRDHGGTR